MTEAALAGNLPNVGNGDLLDAFKPKGVVIGNSYVVLSNDFVLHIGLFDKQRVTFFIAKGVILTSGTPSFSGVYDFNSIE